MTRLVYRLALAAAVALISRPLVAQGVLGSVRGTVTDPGASAPFAISLAGTAFTTVTDAAGRFRLYHVPAGEYTVRAEAAGRPALELAGVRVSADRVTVVQLGSAEAEARTPPLVAGEGEGGGTLITAEQLERLPVDDPSQALPLAAGVLRTDFNIGIATLPALSLRGSAASQTAIYVDGAPARFRTLGVPGLELSTNSLAEVSVLTGLRSVAGGDGAAAIAYVTRSGSDRMEGHFAGTGEATALGVGVGYARFEGALGGPVPGVRNLTWFVSGSLHGQPSQYRGAGAENIPTYELAGVDTIVTYAPNGTDSVQVALPRYAQVSGTCGTTGNANTRVGRDIQGNYGYACQNLRRATDWSTSNRGQAKLLYTYGRGSSISLTTAISEWQQRQWPGTVVADPLLYTGSRLRSRLAVVNLSQSLGRLLEHPLWLTANVALGSDRSMAGTLDPASQVATQSPALGIEMHSLQFAAMDAIPFPVTDALVRNIRTYSGLRVPYLYENQRSNGGLPRLNPYGVSLGWITFGENGNLTLTSEARFDARALMEWQAAPALQVSGGADYSRTDLSHYEGQFISTAGLDAYRASPWRQGLFAAGRFAERDIVIDAGIRVDRFNAGGEFPVAPGRILTNPEWNSASATDDTAYANSIARVYQPSRTWTAVSPRVSIRGRHGRSTLQAAWELQPQVPSFAQLFRNVNSDLAFSSGEADGFGRDVRPVNSSLAELALSHTLASGPTLALSVFIKSHPTPFEFRTIQAYDPATRSTYFPSELTPRDGSALGAEGRMDWPARSVLSGSIAYSYVRTTWTMPGLPPGFVADRHEDRHAFIGTASLRAPEESGAAALLGSLLRGTSADLVFRLTNGPSYTRQFQQGLGWVAPPDVLAAASEPFGASRLPWTKVLDIRLAKIVGATGMRGTLYVDVLNLLDSRNVIAVFSETGSAVNPIFRDRMIATELALLRVDASNNALLEADGTTVNLTRDCATTRLPVQCVALQRAENRFGNGDGMYTAEEQTRAFTAYYDAFYGAWRFYGPGRTARAGIRLEF